MVSNRIRLSGMASGMDTDSIVKDMIKPQQYKIDQEKKKQALITLKQEAWRDMQKKLYSFHTKFSDKMRSTGTFNTTKITNSNTNAVEVSGSSAAIVGTHTIDKIESLATSAQVVGNKLTVDSSKNYSEVKLKEVDVQVGTITFKDKSGTEGTITITDTTTIKDLETALSESLKDSNVKYDEVNGRFFISSKKTGSLESITFAGDSGTLDKLGFAAGTKEGGDAKILYNGKEITSQTNIFTVNGLNLTLKATTKTTDDAIQISSTRDTNAIYNWAKEFVTEYNKLMEELNEKIDTKPKKGIEPLTSDERKAMSESDIKLWEEKINSSLFYRDEQLTEFTRISRNIIGAVHENFYDGRRDADKNRIEGSKLEYTSLASLGIVTGEWQEKGKLYIHGDESNEKYAVYANKLKEAIEKDPDKVIELFTTIGNKLYEEHNDKLVKGNEIKSSMKFYNDKLMSDQIKRYDERITTLEERMTKMENMYYARFAAMEKMLSSLNSQSSWLSQQFGG